MELTFNREQTFSVDLSNMKVRRQLAEHLEITLAKLNRLAAEEELYELYGDEILGWLDDNEKLWENTDSGQIDGLEIHA